MNPPQFQIKAAQTEDEQRVVEIFSGAAETFNLLNTGPASRAKNLICSYSERLQFDFAVAGYRIGELIVIQFEPGKSPTEKFYAVFDHVVTLLQAAFGNRFAVATAENYTKVPPALPTSEAARSIYRTLLKNSDKK